MDFKEIKLEKPLFVTKWVS